MRLTDSAGLAQVRVEWNDLMDRCAASSVFQTHPWHACWWRAFGAPHQLLVILAYAQSRLVGIAPMMITPQRTPLGRSQRHIHFIGSVNDVSDYCDFIIDPDFPEALTALLDALCEDTRSFGRIDLSHFPAHSPNHAAALEYFRRRNLRTSVELHAHAPVRMLGDWQADLKAANKSSLKRHTGFFRKQGSLGFRRCESAEEILGHLEGFFEQHRSRRALARSQSQFFDPVHRAFFTDLVRELFPYGWLRFDVVLFNDAPLAFHFGFEYRRRFIWYKPTFDVAFAARSPGEVLIKHLLEDAVNRRLEEFDFTVGAEPFKYRFANHSRFNNRMLVFFRLADYWGYRALHHGKLAAKRLLGRDRVSGETVGAAQSAAGTTV